MQSRRTVRTAILAIASLALVIVCYSIYQSAESASQPVAETPADSSPTPAPSPAVAEATESPAAPEAEIRVGREGVPLRGGEGVKQTLYDDDGHVRAQIEVALWKPVGDVGDEFEVEGLAIRLNAGGGQLVYLSGDTGRVKLKSSDVSQFEPRSGYLKGNVSIIVDRVVRGDSDEALTGGQALPKESQRVELKTDELAFDVEYGRVATESPFTVESSEFSIAATGLNVTYNEAANRVEELLITRGNRIEIRSDKLRSAFTLTPEDEAGEAATDATGGADADVSHEAVATPEPTEAPVPDDGIPLLALDGEREEDATPKPAPNDVYTADFDGNVHAEQLAGSEQLGKMLADRLTVMFDFGSTERAATRRGATVPANGNKNTAAGDASTGEDEADQGRLVLTWSGGLRVTSQREEQLRAPDAPQRVHITAVGNPVEVSDGERHVWCKRLVHFRETELTQLYGAEDFPARAVAAELGEIQGQEIVLDRNAGRTSAEGPGGKLTIARSAADRLPGTVQDSTRDKSGSGDVHIGFDGEFVAHFDPPETTEGTETKKRPTLKNARFVGNVDMMHGDERIQCDRIDLDFEAGENSRPNPTRARATGNVVVTQAWREIAARKYMDVDFCMVEQPKAPFDLQTARQMAAARGKDPDSLDWEAIRTDYESKKDLRPGLKKLKAEGDVEVRDPQRNVEINCDGLDCTFKDGRQLATGLVTPAEGQSAYVALGKFSIAAGTPIPFDVDAQTAKVDGAGRMTFLTEQNLDGSKRSDPTLVAVKWSDHMSFDGGRNEAVFAGQVHVESEKSTYDCDNLRVDFINAPPPEPSDTASASTKWWILAPAIDRATGGDRDETFTVTGPAFNKEPVFVYATGGVKSLHRNVDEASGKLKSRARIGGPTMAVDLREGYITVQGSGDMLIEDYTLDSKAPPGAARPADQKRVSPFGRSMQNDPSQTYIAWEEAMTYRYKLNVADFEKNVSVVHRTGEKMVKADELLGAALDDEMRGRSREATLNCQSLVVEFVRDPREPAGGAASTSRPQDSATEAAARAGQAVADPIGTIAARGVQSLRGKGDDALGASRLSGYDVSAFNASGQVHFFDSGISAIATQITYTRDDNVLQIQGSEGAPAQLFDQRNRFREMSGPRFVWDRSTNRIWGSQPTGRMR